MTSATELLNKIEEPPSPTAAPGTDAPESAPKPRIIVEPSSGWRLVDLGEIWRYRELLYFLTWRDVKVRYKQTVLGAAWAVLQPLATMLVFSLFLGRVARDPGSTQPYPLFVLAGLIPWTFFANAISTAGLSVVGSQNLVTKVYFPRLIIPMGAVGAGVVDFLIAFVLLIPAMVWYGVAPNASVAALPITALGLAVAALGVGTLLSALTVAYRDFRHVLPFLTQFWMFATPAIYLQSQDVVGSRLSRLLPLNPAQGLIDNFRRSLLGEPIDAYSLTVSLTVGAALLLVGCLFFRRVERDFADII